jgi:hypothetical protein
MNAKLLRWLVGLAVLVPALGAFAWAAHAAHWPEPWLERSRLGEVSWSATWLGCTQFLDEPVHLVPRLLHHAVLAIPGATFATPAWLTAGFAVLLVVALAGALRRAFVLPHAAAWLATGIAGLLVAAPAHRLTWLAGERLGMPLPALLLLLALRVLDGEGRPAWRRVAALGLAALAPFCHTHGCVVAFALLPALAASTARTGSPRRHAWFAACLLVGFVTAAISLRPLPALLADHQIVATLRTFAERVGAVWGDALPATRTETKVVGLLTLLALALLPWLGDRSAVARERAAPWWACALFGLLLLAFAVARYGTDPPSGTWREATFGAFLLPVGLAGVAACRFGVGVLRFAAGAAVVLLAQDWHHGIDDLRLARARMDRIAAAMALPAPLRPDGAPASPLRHEAELSALRARGLVPADLAATFNTAPPLPRARGGVAGGTAHELHGVVRSSFWGDPVHVVAAFDADRPDALLGLAWPRLEDAGRSRDVPWTIRFAAPLPSGTRVRVFGYRPGSGSLASLGGDVVLRVDQFEPEAAR